MRVLHHLAGLLVVLNHPDHTFIHGAPTYPFGELILCIISFLVACSLEPWRVSS